MDPGAWDMRWSPPVISRPDRQLPQAGFAYLLQHVWFILHDDKICTLDAGCGSAARSLGTSEAPLAVVEQ